MGRLRAYVVDLQSSLNAHLAGLGSHERIEVDGEWGEHTALAFGRVCRVLGIEPARNVRTFRLVVGATQQRTPEELARAQADGAAYAQRLRHHFAHEGTGERRRRRRSAPRRRRGRARDPRQRRALRDRRRARGPALGPARRAGLRGPREGDRLSQRLRPRRRAQPGQEPAGRPAGGHRGELSPVPRPPPPGARQPGRRADAADEPVAAGPRRPARGLLAAGPQHPRRARVPRGQHPPHGPARRGGGLQRLGPGGAALRRRRAGPRAAVGRAAARRAPAASRARPPRRPGPGPAPRRHAADLPPGVAADARARHRGLPAAAQRALRRLEHRQAHRRRRRVRADDAPGGAAGRLRAGDLGDRARPRRDARAAQQAAPPQPAHARRGRARRPGAGVGSGGCAASTRASGAQAALAYARKHLGVVESPPSTNRGPLIDRWNRATGTMPGARGAATSPTRA